MNCLSCGRTDELHSGIKNGKIYSDLCLRCVGVVNSAELAGQNRRQWQRRHYAKDIVQPNDSDYIKAYGIDKARERGWSEADIRKFS